MPAAGSRVPFAAPSCAVSSPIRSTPGGGCWPEKTHQETPGQSSAATARSFRAAEGIAGMRIIVVNVNTSESMTQVIGEAARRYASSGTEIVALQPFFGADAVDCAFESYLSAVAVMDRVGTCREPYDAVGLAGFGEHGRDRLQELITQPVVQSCEASAHVAMMIGRTYSVVTTLQRSVPAIEDRLGPARVAAPCASAKARRMSTHEGEREPPAAPPAGLVEGRKALPA